MFDVGCLMLDSGWWVLYCVCWKWMLDVVHVVFNVGCWLFEVGCWTPDIVSCVLDSAHGALYVGRWICHIVYSILDMWTLVI